MYVHLEKWTGTCATLCTPHATVSATMSRRRHHIVDNGADEDAGEWLPIHFTNSYLMEFHLPATHATM